MVTMPEKVSTLEIRQRIGDLLNRVSLRQDEFIIERKGKPLAALVPVARLQQMQRFARQQALELMEAQKGGALSRRGAAHSRLRAEPLHVAHLAPLVRELPRGRGL